MSDENLFPNPSLEGSWWHPGGIPELQIPTGWDIAYHEGANEIDPPWPYVRPELRVLPRVQLPQHEQYLILDGDRTGKGFKGNGPIMFHLFSKDPIYLPAGHGVLTVPLYPDIIMGYDPDDGGKIWADDPRAGMVRVMHGNTFTSWSAVEYGVWNTLTYEWDQDSPTEHQIGFGVRCPFPLPNNGWFFDALSLYFTPASTEDTYRVTVKVPAGYSTYGIDMHVRQIRKRDDTG